jgi:hypothetical protein
MIDTCFISNDLAEFLVLNPDFQYQFKKIKNIIMKKKLTNNEVQSKFPNLQFCFCGSCKIDNMTFLNYVIKNCIIKNDKPKDFCYEYKQEPIKINKIDFDL